MKNLEEKTTPGNSESWDIVSKFRQPKAEERQLVSGTI